MSLKSRFTFLLFMLLLLIPFLNTYASSLTVSTDKPEYNRGQAVTIFISDATPGCDLGVQVENPAGGVWADQVKADSQGKASTTYKVPPDAIYGTYTVTVAGGGYSASCTFKVVEVYVPPPPPPPPPKGTSSITISVSRETIMLGENVTIEGTLSPSLNVTVKLMFTSPNGSEVSKSVSTSYGAFTYVFKPDSPGYWTIKATWEGNNQYEGCVSNTVSIVVRTTISLQVIVAPSITGIGGKIVVYAGTSPYLAHRLLTILYFSNKTMAWRMIGTFETSTEGFVTYIFTPNETGEYVFRAEWVGDSVYTPASANSSKVLVTTELMSVEDIIKALSQLKELQSLLGEKEKELKASSSIITGLQKSIADLQANLSSAQSRISSLERQLAEAESRVQFTTVLGLVAGVLIGLMLGYLLLRRRFGSS
ncbi:MAG: hypothetical protein QXF82_08805 [Nitrososphaeria archaeon]